MQQDSSSRIIDALQRWIATAPPGAQLPGTRALVAEYGASPVTVQKALRHLVGLGLVETRPGVGTFTRAPRTRHRHDYSWQTAALGPRNAQTPRLAAALRIASSDAYDLGSGFPDSTLLPERLVRTALARAARGRGILSWPSAAGMPDLRAWFAAELAAQSSPGISAPAAADVVILPGSQSGLSAAFRALVSPGEPLLIESPTYWGAILAAAQADVQLVPIPSSPEGPDPAALDRAFRHTGARAFYAQPSFANPHGALWPQSTRAQVLVTVREHGAFVIEDDWAHDFAIDAQPRPLAAQDDAGHVVYLRSLTKSVSPAIRVGAVIARGPARERLLHVTQAESVYVSALLQTAALEVVTSPSWRTHLRDLAQQLGERRDLLAQSLHEHAPLAQVDHLPRGGLHLWPRLPEGSDVSTVVEKLQHRDISVVPGSELFPAEPTAPHLRLTFAGPDPGNYPTAARALQEVLQLSSQDLQLPL